MTSEWTVRCPDLAGKAMVVTGQSPHLVEIARQLGRNGALLAVVALDQELVQHAVSDAETSGTPVFGMVTDPSNPAVWARITSHIEQRLGPIDVTVVAAPAATRAVVAAALLPDMAARRRGVLIEIDTEIDLGPDPGIDTGATPTGPPAGVRIRGVISGAATDARDVAAVTVLLASDTVRTPSVLVTLDQGGG
jgi:short chain dehydrogenase